MNRSTPKSGELASGMRHPDSSSPCPTSTQSEASPRSPSRHPIRSASLSPLIFPVPAILSAISPSPRTDVNEDHPCGHARPAGRLPPARRPIPSIAPWKRIGGSVGTRQAASLFYIRSKPSTRPGPSWGISSNWLSRSDRSRTSRPHRRGRGLPDGRAGRRRPRSRCCWRCPIPSAGRDGRARGRDRPETSPPPSPPPPPPPPAAARRHRGRSAAVR